MKGYNLFMLQIVEVRGSDKRKYLNFYKKIQRHNKLGKDSLSILLKNLLYKKATILQSTEFASYIIYRDKKIAMIFSLALANEMKDTMQIAFFESREYDEEAFDLLMRKAVEEAKVKNAIKISGGLNLHVNYGLGFLASHFDKEQSFGLPYNKAFYLKYFEKYKFNPINMVSYLNPMTNFELPIKEEIIRRITKRYNVRPVNYKNFASDIKIYTELNNKAFKEHLFYYERDYREDLEFFSDFKHLLKPENLLIVEKNGKAVGFMLWYPDYNQIMGRCESVGLMTVVKNKIFGSKINKFKIVEMGIIPQEQKRGAVLALFIALYKLTKNKYEVCESSWILEENSSSKSFGEKWAREAYKQYRAFIQNVEVLDVK